MTTQTVFDQALEALAILRVNRTVQLSHSAESKVADAVSALLAAKQDAVSDAQPVALTDDEIVAMSSRAGLPCFNDEHRKRSIRLVRDALAASPAPDVRPSVPSDEQIIGDLTAAFTKGYHAGHHETAEGSFIDVRHSDQRTYFEEAVRDILAEGEFAGVSAILASQPAAPVQQEPDNDVGTDYECSACGKLNYRPNGCGNCGLEYEDAAPAPRVSADSPTTANAGDQEGGGA